MSLNEIHTYPVARFKTPKCQNVKFSHYKQNPNILLSDSRM